MKYKQIVLNVDRNKCLYFTEYSLPYDREDQGEYIFVNTANVYRKSNFTLWKKKMLAKFKEDALSEIDKLCKIVKDLENAENALNV